MMHAHLIEQIAQLVGVADRHQDHTGRIVETPLESKAAVLEGLGLPVGNEAKRSRVSSKSNRSESARCRPSSQFGPGNRRC